MIYLFFPIGHGTGWDTCGKYLTIELSKLDDISIITESKITLDTIGNELEYLSLSQIPINNIDETNFDRSNRLIKGVSIRMLNDFDLSLWLADIRSERIIGYTFYCGSHLSQPQLDMANAYDIIIAGSSFCETQLNRTGITSTKTIIQGINPQIFNPSNAPKALLKDRFVIFSGGKFELRKGQDIVLRAFKIFSDKHTDAILVNSWVNMWEFSLNTMANSAVIEFAFNMNDYMASMNHLYTMNGIDPKKVITLPIKLPYQMAYIFKNTNVGLFPNRCEGGTNLMLMEYMACGKPVIATSKTGHSDVIESERAFDLTNYIPLALRTQDHTEYQGWVEPDIDEIVAYLELAYDDPGLCEQKGKASGRYLSGLTWQKAASDFYKIAKGYF